jgi:ATP-dependent RNA circularization protein (DNA/RNA ligase family)
MHAAASTITIHENIDLFDPLSRNTHAEKIRQASRYLFRQGRFFILSRIITPENRKRSKEDSKLIRSRLIQVKT